MNSNALMLSARSQTQKTGNLLIGHSRKGKTIRKEKNTVCWDLGVTVKGELQDA